MGSKFIFHKIIVLTLFVVIIVGKAFSGSPVPYCEISGIVQDSITKEGLPFASVQIVSQNDSNLMKGVIADESGNYIIKNIIPGKYRLMASYMGYNESEIIIDIRSGKEKHNFLLTQKSFSLSEITVTAEKSLIEKNIEKTIVNVTKNTTLTGGTAIDVMQTLPSVDVDIDGNIHYRGSDRVLILLNGEKSELVRSLDQIPADRIEKIELINNPSAKYDAEGMSGIINIVLKTGKAGEDKITFMLNAGYPETLGGNSGYSGIFGKARFFVNAGVNHNTKYQIKEHLRENYENPDALNYYQFDRQDGNLNNAMINTNLEYTINNRQHIGLSVIGSKNFNSAGRDIYYETRNKTGQTETESLKEIDIDSDNYTIDGNVNYHYSFKNSGQFLKANFHYSLFNQLQEMNNDFFPELMNDYTELQNTYSEQLNKEADLSLDYSHALNDSMQFEAGYKFSGKDLLNDFDSESYDRSTTEWTNDTALANRFNYIQQINAFYLNINARIRFLEIQAGVRAEYTNHSQNNKKERGYFDFFPSITISQQLNRHFTVFTSYNRRINRPTIYMLTPYTDEYADVLNMNQGNPELKPEYVNSYEAGNRFVFDKFSGSGSVYYRHIDSAISRIKSASNDSAFIGSFKNLDRAKLFGGEVAISFKPFKWWSINSGANIFYTNLIGEYGNNQVNTSKTGWNVNILNQFKLPKDFGFQLSGYYRSKLPSVMGTYKERYYIDIAVNKKIFKNKGQVVFKISDVFNMYEFGHDIDAMGDDNFRYSQTNSRKIESRYFIFSFLYNINGREQQKKGQKENFFLDDFDK